VIVSVDVPGAVVVLELTVKVDAEEAGFGLKEAVAPVGRPVTPSETEPAKPFVRAIDTVYVVLPPALTARLAGVALSEKSGAVVPALSARKTLMRP
jgi:hypothetical protein